jgi:hypothetical protein
MNVSTHESSSFGLVSACACPWELEVDWDSASWRPPSDLPLNIYREDGTRPRSPLEVNAWLLQTNSRASTAAPQTWPQITHAGQPDRWSDSIRESENAVLLPVSGPWSSGSYVIEGLATVGSGTWLLLIEASGAEGYGRQINQIWIHRG